MDFDIRWMRREDFSAAAEVMKASELNFGDKQMERLVSKTSAVCMVATDGENRVVGVLAYDMARVSKIKVLALVVREEARRQGVGSGLMSLVTSRLNGKRNKVELSVSEYNLGGQLFLKSSGFRAVSIVDNPPLPSEYKFVYRLQSPAGEEA